MLNIESENDKIGDFIWPVLAEFIFEVHENTLVFREIAKISSCQSVCQCSKFGLKYWSYILFIFNKNVYFELFYRWYCFDLVIVMVSIATIFLEHLNIYLYNVNPAIIKAMRLLRVVRGKFYGAGV